MRTIAHPRTWATYVAKEDGQDRRILLQVVFWDEEGYAWVMPGREAKAIRADRFKSVLGLTEFIGIDVVDKETHTRWQGPTW